MKNHIFNTTILFLLYFPLLGQTYEWKNCCNRDSLGRGVGFWQEPGGFLLIIDIDKKKGIRGIEGWYYGYKIEGKRVGIWDFKNLNGELVGQVIYLNDSTTIEISLPKQKVSAISLKHIYPNPDTTSQITSFYLRKELFIFNKKGKLIKRLTLNEDGDDYDITEY
ncbi:MAG: hypothetical protein JJU02_16095 [Cryomorphaceae bacterium]|nr:hypothetical protein [Cryomorphaceae bacterium]